MRQRRGRILSAPRSGKLCNLPSGAKARHLCASCGTAEAVPFQILDLITAFLGLRDMTVFSRLGDHVGSLGAAGGVFLRGGDGTQIPAGKHLFEQADKFVVNQPVGGEHFAAVEPEWPA
jgi:hypothetical protein